MVPIYQKGRYGEIDYQGGVGMAGLILLSKVCGVVVSAEQSGAVQFFLISYGSACLVKGSCR